MSSDDAHERPDLAFARRDGIPRQLQGIGGGESAGRDAGREVNQGEHGRSEAAGRGSGVRAGAYRGAADSRAHILAQDLELEPLGLRRLELPTLGGERFGRFLEGGAVTPEQGRVGELRLQGRDLRAQRLDLRRQGA